jgi:hypothetical protein
MGFAIVWLARPKMITGLEFVGFVIGLLFVWLFFVFFYLILHCCGWVADVGWLLRISGMIDHLLFNSVG